MNHKVVKTGYFRLLRSTRCDTFNRFQYGVPLAYTPVRMPSPDAFLSNGSIRLDGFVSVGVGPKLQVMRVPSRPCKQNRVGFVQQVKAQPTTQIESKRERIGRVKRHIDNKWITKVRGDSAS